MTRRAAAIFLALASLTLGGCGRTELSGPPELRAGRDECAECGMLIIDDRFACALLIDRSGRREHALYDDLGCMLDDQADPDPDTRVLEGFVRDHATRAWIPSGVAIVLRADPEALHSPMGSGLAAFADQAAAERARLEYGGGITDYARLLAGRQEGAARGPGAMPQR